MQAVAMTQMWIVWYQGWGPQFYSWEVWQELHTNFSISLARRRSCELFLWLKVLRIYKIEVPFRHRRHEIEGMITQLHPKYCKFNSLHTILKLLVNLSCYYDESQQKTSKIIKLKDLAVEKVFSGPQKYYFSQWSYISPWRFLILYNRWLELWIIYGHSN